METDSQSREAQAGRHGRRVRRYVRQSHPARPGLIAALCSITLVAGCGEDPAGPAVQIFADSEHFHFQSTSALATQAELDEGISRAEELWNAIGTFVGVGRLPNRRITVRLDGDKRDRNGGDHIDDRGVVHLLRRGPAFGGYFGALAHEIVHALRYDYWHQYDSWSWPNFPFLDEGFAEFVAMQVDPAKTGFPYYWFNPDVVAGHWLARGESIPPATLRDRHRELNTKCEHQAYPLRAYWLLYIEQSWGRQAVLDIVYAEVPTTDEFIANVLGQDIEQVDDGWAAWLLSRYAAAPGADAEAEEFRSHFDGIYVCRVGTDF